MKFRGLWSSLLLRTISRELTAIHRALDQQNVLLARLADFLAPAAPPRPSTEEARDTGVSFLDGIEAGLVLDYVERTTRDTGAPPDEDAIMSYLADEKTQDLHTRLRQREQEMAARLARRREEG